MLLSRVSPDPAVRDGARWPSGAPAGTYRAFVGGVAHPSAAAGNRGRSRDPARIAARASIEGAFCQGVGQGSTQGRASWLALARTVEDAGFDALVVADHPGIGSAPFVALAAAAVVTDRIHVGTCVANAGVWDPVALRRGGDARCAVRRTGHHGNRRWPHPQRMDSRRSTVPLTTPARRPNDRGSARNSPIGVRPRTGRTGQMQRGEVWFAATPGGDRPVLVLTRHPVADRIGSVVVDVNGRGLRESPSSPPVTSAAQTRCGDAVQRDLAGGGSGGRDQRSVWTAAFWLLGEGSVPTND